MKFKIDKDFFTLSIKSFKEQEAREIVKIVVWFRLERACLNVCEKNNACTASRKLHTRQKIILKLHQQN